MNTKKNVTISKVKKHLDFLESNKDLVGLSDWSIKVNTREPEQGNILARTEIDIYEQVMTIYLSSTFMKTSKENQENILLHELLHGRLLVYRVQSDKASELLEEQMINDITRGLIKLLK